MEFESREEFPDALKGQAGFRLRAVSVCDRKGYEAVYLREDVDTLCDHEMFEDAHEGMILEGLDGDYLESHFSVGDLQCALYGFESAFVFHVIGSDYDGMVFSLDDDTDVPLASFVDVCEDGLALLS